MPTINEVQRLQGEIEDLKRALAKSEGVLESMREKHKGLKIKDLKKKIGTLTKHKADLEAAYAEKLKAYEKKYGS